MNATAPPEEELNESLTVCQVCFDEYGSDPQKLPRMLTCGHSFCHTCLQQWWRTHKNVCPTCKQNINYSSIDKVPINYQLQDAAKEISKLQDSLSSLTVKQIDENELKYEGHCSEHYLPNQLKYEGHCSEHHLPNQLKCMDCLLLICGTCQFVKHKTCQVDLYEDIVRSLMNETNESINKIMIDCGSKLDKLKPKLITIENELEICKTEKRINENIIKNLKEQQESLTKCETVTDHKKVQNRFETILAIKNLTYRLAVLDPSAFCKKNNLKLRQELPEGGPVKYGRIELGSDDRIRIYHFEESTSEIEANSIQFENLLSDLNVEQILPLEVFFKVDRENEYVGELIIEVDSLSPRGINLILRASGILHDNYLGIYFSNYNDSVGTDPFPALVKDIQDGGIYSGEKRRGMVFGHKESDVDGLSRFGIYRKDFNERDEAIFGRVTKGMEIADHIQWTDSIKECGLVIYKF